MLAKKLKEKHQNLLEQLKTQTLSQSYLFYGSPNSDWEEVVLLIINRVLNSNFLSLEEAKLSGRTWFVQPTRTIKESDEDKKKSLGPLLIRKDTIQEAINFGYSATGDLWLERVLVFQNLEKGNKYALSKLLKFLEQLSEELVVIIVSFQLQQIPITIRSRCVCIKLNEVEKETKKIPEGYKNLSGFLNKYYFQPSLLNQLPQILEPTIVDILLESYAKLPKKQQFFHFLSKWLNQENAFFLIKLLKILWVENSDTALKTLFNFKKNQRERLKQQKFDVVLALEALKTFEEKIQQNFIDFESQKFVFLTKLMTCYGKTLLS